MYVATKGSTDYSYDANGNLKLDNNEKISSITYNYLNLPFVITITWKELLPPFSVNPVGICKTYYPYITALSTRLTIKTAIPALLILFVSKAIFPHRLYTIKWDHFNQCALLKVVWHFTEAFYSRPSVLIAGEKMAAYSFRTSVCHSWMLNNPSIIFLSLFSWKRSIPVRIFLSFLLSDTFFNGAQTKQKYARICCCFYRYLWDRFDKFKEKTIASRVFPSQSTY